MSVEVILHATNGSSSTASNSSAQQRTAKEIGLTIPAGARSALERACQSKRFQPASARSLQAKRPRHQSQTEHEDEDDELKTDSSQSLPRPQSALLRLFSTCMTRGVSAESIHETLVEAWQEDPELTLAILQHARDCRSGKGEKLVVQHALLWLRKQKPLTYLSNLLTFLELGYFKDLLQLALLVIDQHLPSLSDSIPLEVELMAEFLRADRQALADFRAKQHSAPLPSAAPAAAASSAPTAATTPAASTPLDDDDFELVVKPSAEPAAFRRRELASYVQVPRARLTIDLCFAIDCTGSMGAWISEAQRSVVQLVRQVKAEGAESGVADVRLRLACVAYRDYFDAQRFQLRDFVDNVDTFVDFINTLSADGGGDAPEDVAGGLDKALKFAWDTQADARLLVLVADAPGHGKEFSSHDDARSREYQATHYEPALRELVQQMRERHIRFAFTRITPMTDVMLEQLQGWYDDRRARNVLNVLQLGQRVKQLVPLLVEQLTIAALGRRPVTVEQEEEEEKEDEARSPAATGQSAEPSQQPLPRRPSARLSLAGKWAPTEGSHFDRPPYKFASTLAKQLFPQSKHANKEYRQLCSALRGELQVVERLMCTQQWAAINFAHVPARAHKILKKAFKKHEPTRYAAFLGKVKRGEVTIKTVGLQPHELIEGYRTMLPPMLTDDTAEAQWKTMVDGVRSQLEKPDSVRALALIDTSGSMTWNMQLGDMSRRGQLGSKMEAVAPIDAAMALALIIAQLSAPSNPFQDRVITFSDEARWVDLPRSASSTLAQRVDALCSGAANGGGTDVTKALTLLLDTAVAQGLTNSDLPSIIFILSDLDFRTEDGGGVKLAAVREQWEGRGLHLPKVVLWNVAARAASADVPETEAAEKESGVALLSGYSLPLVKLALEQKAEIDPMAVLLQAVSPYMNSARVEESER